MEGRPYIAAALAVLWVVGNALPARAAVPSTARIDPWVQARTRHFNIFTNADPGAAIEVGRQLERLCEVFERTNPGLRSTTPLPTDVYAFRNEDSFRDYRPSQTEDIAGWSQRGDDRDMIAFNLAPGARAATEVLFHEFTHSYLRNNLATLPLWLNEGLAEYYSVTSTGRAAAEVGQPIAASSAWCLDHPLLPIQDLFAFNTDSPSYLRAGDLRRTFYAESWLLTRYLLQSTDDNARIFADYMARLRRGEEPEQAFDRALPRARWDALLLEVRGSINQETTRSVRYTFMHDFYDAEVRTEPMDRAEVLYRLGALALHGEVQRHEGSEAHFLAAVGADPTHAPSLAALGCIADLRGRPAEAEARYAQAISHVGVDARTWMIAALGSWRRFVARHPESVEMGDSVPPALRPVRERFARALELEPENPEALAGYGKTFMFQYQPPPEAIDALERASQALPARSDVLVALLTVIANARGHEGADRLLHDALEPRVSRAQFEQLEDLILDADVRLAGRLSKAGRRASAETLLAYVAARSRDPRLREAAQRGLQGRESDPAQDHNSAVALYNQGVSYANQGQYTQALAWFKRAVAATRDSGFKADAERRIGEVRGTLLIQEGVMLFNSGKLSQARKQFLNALTFPLSVDDRRYVRRFIREIDDASAGARTTRP